MGFNLRYNIQMKFIKENWQKLVFTLYAFTVPAISFAQMVGGAPIDNQGQGKIINPLGTTSTIQALIHNVLIEVIKIGLPIVALAVIYCGFLFVAAQGKEEKLTDAKNALLWTLVGAAVLLGSWTLALMIQATVTGLAS